MICPAAFRILPVLFLAGACTTAGTAPGSSDGENLPGAGGSAGLNLDGPDATELCDAADYRDLVGTPAAAATFSAGPLLRVFSVDDLVTQEYLPNRTNVVFDRSGIIVRVWCG